MSLMQTVEQHLAEGRVSRAARTIRNADLHDPGYLAAAERVAVTGAVLTLSQSALEHVVATAPENPGRAALILAGVEPLGRPDPRSAAARIALRFIGDERQPAGPRSVGWSWLAVLLDEAGAPELARAALGRAHGLDTALPGRMYAALGVEPGESEFDMQRALRALLGWLGIDTRVVPANEDIAVYDGALSELACAYLRAAAEPMLKPATVLDPRTGEAVSHPHRTSYSAQLPRAPHDPVVEALLYQLAPMTGLPSSHIEPLAILRYQPGQEYKPHGDWLPAATEQDRSHLAQFGQRTHTLLVYLNTPDGGGALRFPELDREIEARARRAVCFRNTDAQGRPLESSLHASVPVTEGEKWTASLWFRERPVPR